MMRIPDILRFAMVLAAFAASLACQDQNPREQKAQALEMETQRTDETMPPGDAVSEPPEAAQKAPAPPSDQPDPRAVYHVPLTGTEPQKGPDDALFTLVAFGDYQCPFCKNMEPVLEELRRNHPDDLRIVWIDFPLSGHRNARAAATAALEAQAQKGDKGYWQMHDKLFEHQRELNRENLEKLAKELGLNMRKFRRALDTDKYAALIDRQVALGTALGFPGTPAFYLNGRYIPGLPLQTWEGALQRRRYQYERIVQDGVPKSRLYEVVIANGKTSL